VGLLPGQLRERATVAAGSGSHDDTKDHAWTVRRGRLAAWAEILVVVAVPTSGLPT
jgi:hypothetical protein